MLIRLYVIGHLKEMLTAEDEGSDEVEDNDEDDDDVDVGPDNDDPDPAAPGVDGAEV